MSRALLLSLPLACLSVAPALAVDATAERAVVAEDAIRDFLKDMLGPSVPVGAKPVQLKPNGDHYDATATVAAGQRLTASVRERTPGVWAFDTLRYPNPLHFTMDLPSPAQKGADQRLTYDIKSAQQDGAGTIDSTFATPSTASTSARAADVAATGADQSSSTRMGNIASVSTLRAGTAPGTVDLLSTSSMADYSLSATAQVPDTALSLRLDADAVVGRMEMLGIVRAKGMAAIRSAATVLMADYASMGQDPKKPFDTGPAHVLVQQLDGLATSMVLDNVATKLRGVVNGFAFSTERVRMGIDGRSPDGLLALGMELEVSGLTLPALAGTPMAAFIPSKVQLHPSVSGVNTHDFLAALAVATDPARPKDAGPPPEMFALLGSKALAGGIDSLEIDLGTTVLKGAGKVSMPVAGQVAGAGQITVTGFDALTDRVKALPQANQALPVMLFAKGIGRTDGDRLVWDMTYDGTKFLVNGVDVAAMAGGGKR